MAPVPVATLMLGPAGLLLYLSLRAGVGSEVSGPCRAIAAE